MTGLADMVSPAGWLIWLVSLVWKIPFAEGRRNVPGSMAPSGQDFSREDDILSFLLLSEV